MEKLFSKNCKMILSIILVLTLISLGTDSFAATKASIKFNNLPSTPITLNMAYNDGFQFKVTVKVPNGMSKDVKWSVKNRNGNKAQKVTISSNGVLRGVKEGSESIVVTAILKDNTKVKASTYQQVYVRNISGESEREKNLTISKKQASLNWGQEIKLVVKENKTTIKPQWISGNSKIVSVNENGVIKGISAGKTIITAKYKGKAISCTVTVKKTSLANVAKTLKEQIKSHRLVYDPNIIDDFETSTPLTKGRVDCSTYVSWVIYTYGKANGIQKYISDFRASRNATEIKMWCDSNSGKNGACKCIGKLVDVKDKLKPGDIIAKSMIVRNGVKIAGGHVEIFAKYNNGERWVYNCGNDDAITGAIAHPGASSVSPANYVVYRLTK